MRKFLIPLILAIVASCAASPWKQGVPAVQARESVYKVKVVLTVDITELLPKPKEEVTEGAGGAKSTWKPAPFVLKTNDLSPHIMSSTDSTAKVGWSGTGWVAARENGRSYVMTAGHVCESGEFLTVSVIDWETFTIRDVKLPIIEKKHTLLSREDIEMGPAVVLSDEDLNEETMSGPDMCLLGVQGDVGIPLPIANGDPEYATHAEVIGAPTGLWGGNIAVTADLKFSGRGNVWGGSVAEGLAFTGDVAGGNSGSAIMKDGRVVAMLNLGGSRFKELTTGVPWETLRDFLRRSMHKAPGKD